MTLNSKLRLKYKLSFTLDVPLPAPGSSKVKVHCVTQITGINNHWKRNIYHELIIIFKDKINIILCCPVLNPQITGDPGLPGLVMLKVSVRQSPILPPILLVAVPATAVVVPAAGPAMSKV